MTPPPPTLRGIIAAAILAIALSALPAAAIVYQQGDTATIWVDFVNSTGAQSQADTCSAIIYSPPATQDHNTTMTRVAGGLYNHSFALSQSAILGLWAAIITCNQTWGNASSIASFQVSTWATSLKVNFSDVSKNFTDVSRNFSVIQSNFSVIQANFSGEGSSHTGILGAVAGNESRLEANTSTLSNASEFRFNITQANFSGIQANFSQRDARLDRCADANRTSYLNGTDVELLRNATVIGADHNGTFIPRLLNASVNSSQAEGGLSLNQTLGDIWRETFNIPTSSIPRLTWAQGINQSGKNANQTLADVWRNVSQTGHEGTTSTNVTCGSAVLTGEQAAQLALTNITAQDINKTIIPRLLNSSINGTNLTLNQTLAVIRQSTRDMGWPAASAIAAGLIALIAAAAAAFARKEIARDAGRIAATLIPAVGLTAALKAAERAAAPTGPIEAAIIASLAATTLIFGITFIKWAAIALDGLRNAGRKRGQSPPEEGG